MLVDGTYRTYGTYGTYGYGTRGLWDGLTHHAVRSSLLDFLMFPAGHLSGCEVQVGADDDGSLAGMQIFMEILLAHDLVECDISRFIELELKEVNPIAADGDRVDAPVRGL